MIQEIAPLHLNNQYRKRQPADNSRVCVFRDQDIMVAHRENEILLPDYAQLENGIRKCVYLFSVDDTAYFLADYDGGLPEGFMFEKTRALRLCSPQHTVFACMTAWHLYIWYRDNQFCGRCGHKTAHDEKLRMMLCPECGNMIFPKICPAVIVGVIWNDKILLTKYSGRAYKNYALIAGFCEIGETAEETVEREVFEETGVHVKNIRYWATQPWGIDTDLLLGYFCELDGDPEITLDQDELSLAGWYGREQIDMPVDHVSLTHDMIRAFIENRHMQPRG